MTDKKISRFERFKGNQRDEIVTAQKLKNKLLLLANDMLKAKQISKAVFNKMEKLTLYRTRKNTLLENFNALQHIEGQFRNKQAHERETRTNTKKFSIKELQNIQKEAKAEGDIKYNVYIKYKAYRQADDENDETLERIKIDGKLITVVSFINHETIKVAGGMNNIRDNLKMFIASIMDEPYIIKVDILKVAVNKEMISDQKYRWLGAESSKKKIRYFKAWDSNFTHHKYNLDNNDEIPFECVPNALYKMYGDRNNKGYIASIAKGGLDYIKRELDGHDEVSDLDFGLELETIKEDKKGYSPDQILKFCNKHKIRCFGYNWLMQQFITNKYDEITFNHDNLPAFVFYMNDEHIYLIQDKETRHAILRASDKNDIVSLIAKQRDTASKKEREAEMAFELWDIVNDVPLFERVDLPFEQWNEVSNNKIYITKQRLVHDTFYKLLCKGDVYNNKLKMSEGEGVKRFQHENGNTIIYNPDYYDVQATLKNLDATKYAFNNQRINTLAKEVLDKEFGGLPESAMNQQGDDVFHSDFIRNCQFNGWISEPKSDNLYSYDYNKHYTSCLRGDGLKFGFPIYNVFDEVMPFDGQLKTGFYFVETKNFFPLRGNGWYDADLIYFCIKNNVIEKKDIKFQYCSSQELPVDHFKKFIDAVYTKFKNPKAAINKLIGCFGHDYKNKNIHHFTSDARNVFLEVVNNPDAQIKYVYHSEFLDDSDNKVVNVDEVDISSFISTDKPVCYHLYNNKRVKHLYNSLPLFYKIYNVSAMKMYQMAQKIDGTVRGIFTDTIIFEGEIKKPVCDASIIGGIRKSTLKSFTRLMDTQPRNKSYIHNVEAFNHITEYKLGDKGVFITGLGGTGKSYTINQLKSQLQPETFRVCTPTLKSALIVGAVTVYNLFNINPHDHTYCKSTVEKLKASGVKHIFIDEVSMINSKVWACIREFKKLYGFIFILSGDFGQLPPVEAIEYDVLSSQVFHYVCDGQIMELTKNWRAEKCPEFKSLSDDWHKVRNGDKINFKNYGSKECRKSLCWTNRTRNIINKRWMLKEAEGKEYILVNNWKIFPGLPIIANESRNFKSIVSNTHTNVFEVVDTIGYKQMKNPKWGDIHKLLMKEKYISIKYDGKTEKLKRSKIKSWNHIKEAIMNSVQKVLKVSKETQVVNNEEFAVTKITSDFIEITNDRCTLGILYSQLKFFDLAYCLTVHKSQGSTYDFEYSIYEYHRFSHRMLYTAMSRTTEKRFVNFVYMNVNINKGYIYKITSPAGKIYIGSTSTSMDQRFKEHMICNDNSPLHRDMKADPQGWKIEEVEALEYVDEQELLIAETCHMMTHDSINNGYNTKYSVDLLNLY